jgi:mannosyl-oligosaccharide glucosidase
LGTFTVTVVDRKGEKPTHVHPSFQEKPIDKTLVHSVQIPEAALWQAKRMLDCPHDHCMPLTPEQPSYSPR